MSGGTIPTQECDYEDGCDQWIVNYYEMYASNWRALLPAGWLFDPHTDSAYCPEHKPTEATR